MKKIVFALCVFAGSVLIPSDALFAQVMTDSTMAPAKLDEKTQKKVDGAKEQLAKDQEQMTKDSAKYQKDLEKFEKDKRKGKLSPDKEAKEEKALRKDSDNLGKLKKRIADNEALLAKYKQ